MSCHLVIRSLYCQIQAGPIGSHFIDGQRRLLFRQTLEQQRQLKLTDKGREEDSFLPRCGCLGTAGTKPACTLQTPACTLRKCCGAKNKQREDLLQQCRIARVYTKRYPVSYESALPVNVITTYSFTKSLIPHLDK